ncbi:hypothetical protein B9Z55_012781 [Caenorhabditis nigoni]|uniref:F-box domain-containing protein n=1 Tax=Caenorhabditis nigoni TaxID=1611254 RepID=A0A2G5TZD3_9PELO|nr:hypothetical protein B9Z55_012781 [Caenorhabditis nigoni]
MSSDIENLAKQTENLSIEPIYNTNWCDMPAEIKVECIGKMELIERLSLRSTAKDERSLVDSQTIKFRKGEFRGNAYCFDASLYSENGYELSKNLTDSSNEAFEFVRYIWKVGVFENLKISFYGTAYTRKMKKYTGEIKAKNVELHYGDILILPMIVQKLNDGIESIMTYPDSLGAPNLDFNKLFAIPQIQNVPYWHIGNCDQTESLHRVAKMWIDRNSKVGCTFQIYIFADGSFKEFLEHFTERIVSKNEKRARIRTNNPDRHIILERGLIEIVDDLVEIPQFFRLMVISVEMKESEYDDNCEKWISKICPEYRKENNI